MNERDKEALQRMLLFSERVQLRISDLTLEQFLINLEKQDAILYSIGQVGECANIISEETREKYSHILWNPIIGIRNRVFHSYEDIDMTLIFETASVHMPKLIQQLKEII
jgi:uncharacterized protein with HEPN domain